MFGGKREILSRALLWSGSAFVLNQLPQKSSLLVLNYHRIANGEDLFDHGIISATPDGLDAQMSYLKRHAALVTLEEALAFVERKLHDRVRRSRVLVTFDDGYLDNYQAAFPILRSHGVPAVFFL